MLAMNLFGSSEGSAGALLLVLISILMISFSLRTDSASRPRDRCTYLLLDTILEAAILMSAMPFLSPPYKRPVLIPIASLAVLVAIYSAAILIVKLD